MQPRPLQPHPRAVACTSRRTGVDLSPCYLSPSFLLQPVLPVRGVHPVKPGEHVRELHPHPGKQLITWGSAWRRVVAAHPVSRTDRRFNGCLSIYS